MLSAASLRLPCMRLSSDRWNDPCRSLNSPCKRRHRTQPSKLCRMNPLICRFPRSYNSAREAAMVVHSEVFERFTQGDTIPVMTQAAMENALSPRIIDQLFEDVAERQYTRDLLFSSIVELMSLVVCRIQPSINAAYQKNAVPIAVSLQAIYRKLNG